MEKNMEKITLFGFNNLTKTLSFNIFDVCYVTTTQEKEDYIQYIDGEYNSERLTEILCNVTETIGASVLNISKQDYEPQGASVNILITEEPIPKDKIDDSCNQGEGLYFAQALATRNNEILGHLDKSHLTVHTYPEYHPDKNIATFRLDIEVSTCGTISPLKALNYLIESFDSDIITIDYRVRGFTRDIAGKKLFVDHDMTSIQNYIRKETLEKYRATDVNSYGVNLYHTKMMIEDIHLQNYLFQHDVSELSEGERRDITRKLQEEMTEIYHSRNIY